MTTDKMQDVFPIVFEFKRGEQPTAEKLTGLVRHSDYAFARMSQFIGDPWDQTIHSDGTTSYKLSPENLSQPSVARMLGPSDFLSPEGGCWNERVVGHQPIFTLGQNRNSWYLGFPLVSVVDGQSINHTSTRAAALITPLTWPGESGAPNISISGDSGGCFTNKVANPTLVVSHGDYYVDPYVGMITSYTPTDSYVYLYIASDKLNMFGPGVPWATHNVIPTWEETTNLCTVEFWKSESQQDYYYLTLPTVRKTSRYGQSSTYLRNASPEASGADQWGGSDVAVRVDNTSTSMQVPGLYSDYRLPESIAGNTIAASTTLPDGFCQLWDDSGQRFIPQVTFITRSTASERFNSLVLVTPIGWLNTGTHVTSTNRYRLVVTGISAAENINYLNMLVRNGSHTGLANCPTLAFSPPVSHDYLIHRYAGYIDASASYEHLYKFRESDIPVNPHPQYLHRAGYNADDLTGNSANAMRGDLVFTGDSTTLGLGSGASAGGGHNSWSIMFGGATKNDVGQNSSIGLSGRTSETWTSGPATHFPFNILETASSSSALYDVNYGALSVHSWYGTPLYLRGIYDISQTSYGTADYYKGATLAFDMGQWGEYNHIKLSIPIHDSDTYEVANMPAETGQTASSTLGITPALASLTGQKRLSPYQIREFRFRGGAYLSNATNKDTDSLGAISDYEHTPTGTGEFDAYFTSPGMVGCDFLNIYSNAIFFSDTGDGKRTSFTSLGENWLQTDAYAPSGVYFIPRNNAVAPYFSFRDYDSTLAISNASVSFGYTHGFHYVGNGALNLLSGAAATILGDTSVYITTNPAPLTGSYIYMASTGTAIGSTVGSVAIATSGASHAVGLITYGSTSPISLTTTNSDISITSGTNVDILCVDLSVYSNSSGTIGFLSNNNSISIDGVSNTISVTTGTGGSVNLIGADINLGSASVSSDLHLGYVDKIHVDGSTQAALLSLEAVDYIVIQKGTSGELRKILLADFKTMLEYVF